MDGCGMGEAKGEARTGRFDVRGRARELPELPGVYQFLDEAGRVLYIGKAKNLQKRLGSYSRPHSWLIPAMLERARSVEFTVTATEREALILEAGMVRHLKPRYNVRLKDDKRFPYLKLTGERFPRLLVVRRTADDGAAYFGPFTSGRVHATARFVRKLFGLRPCTDLRPRGCLHGDLGHCRAPCRPPCTEAEYAEAVGQASKYLSGEHRALMAELERRMEEHSARQEYERAVAFRDQVRAISRLAAQQRVDLLDPKDRDALVVRRTGPERALVLQYSMRGGIVVAKKHFSLEAPQGLGAGEVLEAFMTLHYGRASPPPEMILPVAVPGRALLEDWLGSVAGSRVRLVVPGRGPRKRLLELMESDLASLAAAMEGGRPDDSSHDETASELREALGLERAPESIEAVDISTIQGTSSVGSKVRFERGAPRKSGYRRYRIRTVRGQDDLAMMGEVVSRRLARAGEDPLPDLLLMDGGKGQLEAAVEAARRAGRAVALAALAKGREEVFLPGRRRPVRFPEGSRAKLLLQRARDEAHRFAVTYHRGLRSRSQTGSALDGVIGLGKARAAALLRRFSSVRGIRSASEDELRQVEGMGPVLARRVKQVLG